MGVVHHHKQPPSRKLLERLVVDDRVSFQESDADLARGHTFAQRMQHLRLAGPAASDQDTYASRGVSGELDKILEHPLPPDHRPSLAGTFAAAHLAEVLRRLKPRSRQPDA